jgi:cytochrome c551/c552
MRTQAIVMEPSAFDAWLKQQEKGAAPPSSSTTSSTASTTSSTTSTSTTSSSAAGLSVFNSYGCSGCHTLTAAKATGTVGPNLDKLVAYAKQAKQPLESFVHESIVNPDAYIQPGYPKGVMPPDFAQKLNPGQLAAVVTFLVQSAQQAGKKG